MWEIWDWISDQGYARAPYSANNQAKYQYIISIMCQYDVSIYNQYDVESTFMVLKMNGETPEVRSDKGKREKKE